MRNGRLDCSHCGETFHLDMLLEGRGLEIEYVVAITNVFRNKHRSCKLNEKGKALQAANDKYFEESQVKFIATREQLFTLVNNLPECCQQKPFKPGHPNYNPVYQYTGPVPYTREEFDKLDLTFLKVAIWPLADTVDGYKA